MANRKDMEWVKWLMCLLALSAVILAVLIYSKVNKCGKKQTYLPPNRMAMRSKSRARMSRNAGQDIIPGQGHGKFADGGVNCNENLPDPPDGDSYYCDQIIDIDGNSHGAGLVSATGEDMFCKGNAALVKDSSDNKGLIGTCSMPFPPGNTNGGTVCCDINAVGSPCPYGVFADSCDNGNSICQQNPLYIPGISICKQ